MWHCMVMDFSDSSSVNFIYAKQVRWGMKASCGQLNHFCTIQALAPKKDLYHGKSTKQSCVFTT